MTSPGFECVKRRKERAKTKAQTRRGPAATLMIVVEGRGIVPGSGRYLRSMAGWKATPEITADLGDNHGFGCGWQCASMYKELYKNTVSGRQWAVPDTPLIWMTSASAILGVPAGRDRFFLCIPAISKGERRWFKIRQDQARTCRNCTNSITTSTASWPTSSTLSIP